LPATVIKTERRRSDTGERKQVFGRTARHLVSHVTRSDGPETLIDGWYIEAQGLPKGKSRSGGYFTCLTLAVAPQCPHESKWSRLVGRPEGLAVWQKMTSTVAGHSRNYESVNEVTGLSE
jgi:hypothetical protein